MRMIKNFNTEELLSAAEAIKGSELRENLFAYIQELHPTFTKDDFLSFESLNYYRRK